MVKSRFKIPTSLDVTYFDMEFNVKSKNGVGLSKPVTAKVIVFVLLSVFAWFYLVFQSFIGRGGLFLIFCFTVSWIIMCYALAKTDSTKRMGLELLMSMTTYLPKSGRSVPVRISDSVYPLQQLINTSTVDVEDGRIHFLDGYIGYCYQVVGSASALMFEQDKQMIVSKVDAFYRKLNVGVDVIYDTVYEGHSVDAQIQAVEETKNNLSVQSKGLLKLLNEQRDVLHYAINNQRGLISLHQYLVVRAPNESALRDFENLLISDVESDGLMFRLAKSLNYNEVVRYFGSVIKSLP